MKLLREATALLQGFGLSSSTLSSLLISSPLSLGWSLGLWVMFLSDGLKYLHDNVAEKVMAANNEQLIR